MGEVLVGIVVTLARRHHIVHDHNTGSCTHLGKRKAEVGWSEVAVTPVQGGEEADLRDVLHAEFVQHRVLVENDLRRQIKQVFPIIVKGIKFP